MTTTKTDVADELFSTLDVYTAEGGNLIGDAVVDEYDRIDDGEITLKLSDGTSFQLSVRELTAPSPLTLIERRADYQAALSRKENGLEPGPDDARRLAAGDPDEVGAHDFNRRIYTQVCETCGKSKAEH